MSAFDIGLENGVKTASIIPSRRDSTGKKILKGTAIIGGIGAAALGGKKLIDSIPILKNPHLRGHFRVLRTVRDVDGNLIDNSIHSTKIASRQKDARRRARYAAAHTAVTAGNIARSISQHRRGRISWKTPLPFLAAHAALLAARLHGERKRMTTS